MRGVSRFLVSVASVVATAIALAALFSAVRSNAETPPISAESEFDRLRHLLETAEDMHADDDIELIINSEEMVWRRRFHSRACFEPQTAYAKTIVVLFREVEITSRVAVFDRVQFVNRSVRISRPEYTELKLAMPAADLAELLQAIPSSSAKSTIFEEFCDGTVARLDRVRSYHIAHSGERADEVEELILNLRFGST